MITTPDIQVLKDTTDNVPVTREILKEMGFEKHIDLYSVHDISFRKDKITLIEYRAETNSAILKPYEQCYSCYIHFYDKDINYIIYTVKQLKLFLECHDKIVQIKNQAENKVNQIADLLYSTRLQK